MDAESITVKIHLDTEEVRGVIDAMQAEIDGLRKDAERLRGALESVVHHCETLKSPSTRGIVAFCSEVLSEEAKGTT